MTREGGMYHPTMIVLGRGIDREGELSRSAIERVNEAVSLSQRIVWGKIIFAGGDSFLNERAVVGTTEAGEMAEHAKLRGLDPSIIEIEPDSTDTVTNFLYSEPFLKDSAGVTVVAHGDQMKRAIWTGKLVYPKMHVFPAVARGSYTTESYVREKSLHAAYILSMLDIKRGDHRAILERNTQIQRNVLAAKGLNRRIRSRREHQAA